MKFLLALVALVLAKGRGRGRGNPCREESTTEGIQTGLETVAASLLTSGTSYCYLSVYGDEDFPTYASDDAGAARRELRRGGGRWSMSQAKVTITDGDFVTGTTQVFTKDRNAADPDTQFACYDGLTFSVSDACRNWGDNACAEDDATTLGGRRNLHRGRDPETFVEFGLGFVNGDTTISSDVKCTTHLEQDDTDTCVASEFKCSGHYGDRADDALPSGKFELVCKAEEWDMRYWDEAPDCTPTAVLLDP